MVGGEWLRYDAAWQAALYGPAGFYRREQPAAHFRTSAHASARFAEAIVTLARRLGVDMVTDVGAGSGELAAEVHEIAPDLAVGCVELRPRPATLAPAIGWSNDLPAEITGLVVANELIDNLPCPIVEVDNDGQRRYVEVCAASGDERLGEVVDDIDRLWLETWWPVRTAGERAEVGAPRDAYWADVCGRIANGVALAIDYGHVSTDRPSGGSLASYRDGRQTSPTADGHHDLTAHVSFDSLQVAVGGDLVRQRDALRELGISGTRPPLDLATDEPAQYLRELSRASQAGELTALPGLGDFHWLVTTIGEMGAWRL